MTQKFIYFNMIQIIFAEIFCQVQQVFAHLKGGLFIFRFQIYLRRRGWSIYHLFAILYHFFHFEIRRNAVLFHYNFSFGIVKSFFCLPSWWEDGVLLSEPGSLLTNLDCVWQGDVYTNRTFCKSSAGKVSSDNTNSLWSISVRHFLT